MFNPFRLLVKLWQLLFGPRPQKNRPGKITKEWKSTYEGGGKYNGKRLETGFWAEAHLSARTMFNRRKRGRV